MTSEHPIQTLRFFRTPEQVCAYLPAEMAANVVADPAWPMDSGAYAMLLANGFRRSGDTVYRPGCAACSQCVPVRIPVASFTPTRGQRRALTLNEDVIHRIAKPEASDANLALYKKYMRARHANSDMTTASDDQFLAFLDSSWCQTVFIEFRLESRLIATAVTDQAGQALSAVYTFFDPELAGRSLGKLAILVQLQIARARQLKWLYLGYTIADCQNMAYKTAFKPQQHFINGVWQSPG